MESILISIKKMIGISEEDSSFDPELIIHINTAISYLHQLGVETNGFYLIDSEQTWNELIPNIKNLQPIKTYIYAKVKTIFDTPSNASVLGALKEAEKEAEWRIKTEIELGGL